MYIHFRFLSIYLIRYDINVILDDNEDYRVLIVHVVLFISGM